jgi:TfoX/Sxy family transcriptional regulator of competence genes
MPKDKICPLNAIGKTPEGFTVCLQSGCAWWLEGDKMCAVVSLWTIADKLDDLHRLELNKL